MQTSDKGIGFLDRQENDVLKAYRDIGGNWTIGKGLTAASGVVKPHAGMVITQAQSDELTRKALAENYEPAVREAMPWAEQNEFDGAISFHWNTGAIGRASWVEDCRQARWDDVHSNILLWDKADGKAVRGLQLRREREFALISRGDYGDAATPEVAAPSAAGARYVVHVDAGLLAELRSGLSVLGYDPGTPDTEISKAAVQAFQRDHGLTVDGVIGNATIATLQRMLAARNMTLSQLWHYRDAVAAKIQPSLPRLAALLRSI